MKTEKTKQNFKEFDRSLNRTIVKDFDHDSLSIIGDLSVSSITTFWVVDRFNPDIPYSIFISRVSALRQQAYCNEKFNTDVFTIIQRTIFV